jgi:hypothetical protein
LAKIRDFDPPPELQLVLIAADGDIIDHNRT